MKKLAILLIIMMMFPVVSFSEENELINTGFIFNFDMPCQYTLYMDLPEEINQFNFDKELVNMIYELSNLKGATEILVNMIYELSNLKGATEILEKYNVTLNMCEEE